MVKNITAMDKELALRKLKIVKVDLNSLGRATKLLRSARARRGSLTSVLRNKLNLRSLNIEKQRLDLKRKEFEDLIKRQVINGNNIPPSFTSPSLRKSFLEGKKGKIIQVLFQSKRPFSSGRGFL